MVARFNESAAEMATMVTMAKTRDVVKELQEQTKQSIYQSRVMYDLLREQIKTNMLLQELVNTRRQ